MPHFFVPEHPEQKKGWAIEVYLCVLFVSPLNKAPQREMSFDLALLWGKWPRMQKHWLTSVFCRKWHEAYQLLCVSRLFLILIFFCGIPLVGLLTPFAFVQMGSLISVLTFNILGLPTEGLCWHPNIWETSFVYLCVRVSVRCAFSYQSKDIGEFFFFFWSSPVYLMVKTQFRVRDRRFSAIIHFNKSP